MKNKYGKIALKGVVILLSILVVVYTFIFIYVSSNKKKIIKQVTEEVGKKLSGTVSIGDVEISFLKQFPSVAVEIKNVQITDSMYAMHKHAFFKGERVYVNVGVLNMLTKKSFITGFRVDRGNFYLYTDTAGYTNKYLFRPKNDSAETKAPKSSKNQLRKIELNAVRLIDDDRRKNKLYDIVVNELDLDLDDKDENTFLFNTEADLVINSLAFNLDRGSFIKGKKFKGDFELKYDKKIKQLQFDNADIKLDDQPFKITARFDMAGDSRQFSVNLNTKKITYAFARTLVTEKISKALTIADINKPLDVNASIKGPLKGGDPSVVVNFSTKNALLKTPFIDFENATFKGMFTNEVVVGLAKKDPNSRIIISDFSASWKDLPVTSNKIEIMNLSEPILTCDLQSNFSLTAFNDILSSNTLQLRSGTGTASITYKGPVAKNNNTNSFVNGFINFKNGTVLYTPRDVELKNVNGRLIFKSSDVFVENLQCDVLNSKVIMNGTALNLLTLIDAEPNKVNLDWNIYTPLLNLDAFTFLLKAKKKVVVNNPGSNKKLANIAGKLDRVLDEGKVVVNLKATRLAYKKFNAVNAIANISLLQDRYLINNVSMEHAGGRMDLSGSMIANAANRHDTKVNVDLQNVDISKTLEAFSNFGQDGLTSKSIAGKLTAKVNASLAVDNEGKAYPNSLTGVVDFSLKEGALNNYEPVKKMQNFLFKNRNFDNIRFAELKNRFEIKNGDVKINRMEIQSSVLSIFVEGIFNTKGTTDISIQVPLSNIHRPEDDLNPVNIGVNKKVGRSIFLRGRPGPDGNIKFKVDLFNKFKKDKADSLVARS